MKVPASSIYRHTTFVKQSWRRFLYRPKHQWASVRDQRGPDLRT